MSRGLQQSRESCQPAVRLINAARKMGASLLPYWSLPEDGIALFIQVHDQHPMVGREWVRVLSARQLADFRRADKEAACLTGGWSNCHVVQPSRPECLLFVHRAKSRLSHRPPSGA